MSKKNKAAKAAIENELAQSQVVNAEVYTEEIKDQAAKAKAEADELMRKAKEAAEIAKQAAKEAKEAAKKAKAYTSRPVRKSRFEVSASDSGEIMFKSDVHYCAEKAAIDAATQLREQDNFEGITYFVHKVNKENENDRLLVCSVYIDPETKQIVID